MGLLFGALPQAPPLSLEESGKEETIKNNYYTVFAPNTETFSAVYFISVSCRSRLARSLGGLGGWSRIEFIVSPLPRRRHNESHFAAQSPERAFLAKPFFARAKNGVNSGRRSHKISFSEAKCNICRHKRAGALHLISQLALTASPQRGSQSKGHAARLDKRTAFTPNTETFSAVHNISVVCLPRLARSPGGLGGRSRIEPRLLISSLSAGANRGSLRGAVP